jgi:hypothetical protein
VDWDGSGAANAGDEWIELYNGSGSSVNIGGWSLDSGRSGGRSYRIPRGTVLRPGAYLLLYSSRTGLALDDANGQVRLLDAARRVVDSVVYGPLPADGSVSRDELGVWHTDLPPSPGAASLSPATPAISVSPLVFP